MVTLPLPPKELSPNARVHFRKKARAAKYYRAWAKISALSVRTVRLKDPTMVINAFWPNRTRIMDDDNLVACMKPARDGCQDAGLYLDDREVQLRGVVQQCDHEDPRIELVFEGDER
jgi:crossover junction endodeoxyribonuclease RusA